MSILATSLVSLASLFGTELPPDDVGGLPAALPTVLVVGDSYTLRTGQCEFSLDGVPIDYPISYEACANGVDGLEGGFPYEVSYGSYLEPATGFQVQLIGNTGRGSDTCTTQAAYTGDLFAGEPRGLSHHIQTRVLVGNPDIVSILIGINDVNLYGVAPNDLKACLVELYDDVASSGRTIVAMTYPGVSSLLRLDENGNVIPGVWPNMKAASWNVGPINNAIRTAVQQHNADHPSRPVLLADTASAWTSIGANTYTSDGAHPNEAGAQRLAALWSNLVCSGYSAPCVNGWLK